MCMYLFFFFFRSFNAPKHNEFAVDPTSTRFKVKCTSVWGALYKLRATTIERDVYPAGYYVKNRIEKWLFFFLTLMYTENNTWTEKSRALQRKRRSFNIKID